MATALINALARQGTEEIPDVNQLVAERQHQRRLAQAHEYQLQRERAEAKKLEIAQRDTELSKRALIEANGDMSKAGLRLAQLGGSPTAVLAFRDQDLQEQKNRREIDDKALESRVKTNAEISRLLQGVNVDKPEEGAMQYAALQTRHPDLFKGDFDPVGIKVLQHYGENHVKLDEAELKRREDARKVAEEARKAALAPIERREATAKADKAEKEVAGTLPQSPTGEQAEFQNFFLPKFKEAHPELPNNAQTELAAFDAYRASKRAGDSETADYKNYQKSKAEGYKGTFEQWMTADANRHRPVSTTNVIGGTPENPSSTAQMVADYQVPFTSAVARLPGPARDALLAQVKAINPNFQASNFDTYKGTERAFTSGKEATSANALNTMMGHLGTLEEATAALNNGDIQLLNKIGNAIGVQTGKDPVVAFKTIVNRVGPEIAKAYIGGGGGQEERKKIEEDFSPNASPQQIRTAIRVSAQLAESKVKALQDQYNRGTYGRGKQKLLTDEAESIRQRLSGGGSDGGQRREQHSPSTGQYRYSLDGGKTWNPGRLPK